MGVVAVLTAAGSGTRLGADRPKALVDAGGAPLVTLAAHGLLRGGVTRLVVTAPDGAIDEVRRALEPVVAEHPGVPVTVTVGGTSRQSSVAAGLACLAAEAADAGQPLGEGDVALVHDAARPHTPPEVTARVVAAVRASGEAVVPAVPVSDTLRWVHPEDGASIASDDAPRARLAHGLAERSHLMAMQTPQGFPWPLLVAAHEAGAARGVDEARAATDDAGLVEALGHRVHLVDGDPLAFKVTTALDLRLARALTADGRDASTKEDS